MKGIPRLEGGKLQMHFTYILDLETAALPLETLTPPQFKIDSRLKDPAKIEAAQAEKLAEWQNSLALHAETCRILAVGILGGGVDLVLEGDEQLIIDEAWEIIGNTPTVIGHNLRGFDIPMLMRRSWILGIKVPRVMEGKWLDRRFVDTMELWSCGTQDRISLDNLAKALGVGSKSGSGKDFAELYKADPAAALQYLRNDLELTRACASRMGII